MYVSTVECGLIPEIYFYIAVYARLKNMLSYALCVPGWAEQFILYKILQPTSLPALLTANSWITSFPDPYIRGRVLLLGTWFVLLTKIFGDRQPEKKHPLDDAWSLKVSVPAIDRIIDKYV